MHHALNHVRFRVYTVTFRISPELSVVQDRVHGCPELNVVQGARSWTEMYYVYVLRSQLDGKLYIGYTINLRNRLQEHQRGEVTSTKARRPLDLVFYEGYKSMGDAKRRERYLKTSKGKFSLQMMLRDSLKELFK